MSDPFGLERPWTRRYLMPLASCVGVVVLWLAIDQLLDPRDLIPSPLAVVQSLLRATIQLETWSNLAASVALVLVGFLLSVVLALPAAALWERSTLLMNWTRPVHEFLRYIPVPTFVPLFALLLGVGHSTKIALIFVGTYFQLIFMYLEAFLGVPKEYEEVAKTLGRRGLRQFYSVHLPAALPLLLDQTRIAFGWAWSYLLVAEVVNSNRGIGFLVLQAYRQFDLAHMMALMIVIGAFGLCADGLFRIVERSSRRWMPEEEVLT